MSKTVSQIAQDCGLIESQASMLEAIMNTDDLLCPPGVIGHELELSNIAGALCRRIKKLEDTLKNSDTQLRHQTKSWDETLAENRRFEERIEKLEAGIDEALRVSDLEACDEYPDPVGDAIEGLRNLRK